MSTPKFAETHNLVVLLVKLEESTGFEEIIDFLNASYVQYALSVNPTIYTTCIEQFWTSAKVKTVNGERQIQTLVDKQKVIISETSIRSDLKSDDTEGIDCLPTATIFAELERMGYENLSQKLTFYKAYFSSQWKFLIHTILQCLSAKTTSWNEFSSTMASSIICLATNQKFNLSMYIFDNMLKNLDGGVKFLMYPRFVQVFLDKQVEGMSKHKRVYVTLSHTKKVFANMKRPCKGFSLRVTPLFSTMMVQATEDMGEDSAAPSDSHSTPIISQPSSSKLQNKKSRRKKRKDSAPTEPTTEETPDEAYVSTPSYDPPQNGEDNYARSDIDVSIVYVTPPILASYLVKKSSLNFKLMYELIAKVPTVLLSTEATVNRGRKIANLDADAKVTLVDETQEINDDNLMFDTCVLEEQEKDVAEKEVSAADPVTTASEVVTTANVEVTTINAPTTNIDELTLAQTLIKIKAAKPKAVTSAAITTTTIRPKVRGVVVQEPTQLQAELEEEERLARKKEEEANIALLES
ncbi:hypothetical protein Tco_0155910 [Tanacetum coccineum]